VFIFWGIVVGGWFVMLIEVGLLVKIGLNCYGFGCV